MGLFCTLGCAPKAPTPQQASSTPLSAQTPQPSPETRTDSGEELASLKLELRGEEVSIKLPWEGGSLTRSYAAQDGLTRPKLSKKAIPVEGSSAIDKAVPHNILLHYRAESPEGRVLYAQIPVPNKALPTLRQAELTVDKSNYTLDVLDGGVLQKRYPIALGRDPRNRKYCQDMASTPEGAYEIYNLQPDATYHRALDVDYPRSIDHVRHQLAVELGVIEAERPIGGEIQIHGWGIRYDWTAGCMALRDEDMDELFANSGLRAGMPVFISGSQIRPEDRSWLLHPPADKVKKVQRKLAEAGLYQGTIDGQLGNGTAKALGRYQHRHGLAWSCQLDGPTRAHFGL